MGWASDVERDRGEEAMSVDYSTNNFRKSFQAIDEASRSGAAMYPLGSGIRVRKDGDTVIMTEHRDPYSHYWQLDQFKVCLLLLV